MGETSPSGMKGEVPKCQPSLYFWTSQLETTACEKEVACPQKTNYPSFVFGQVERIDVFGAFEVDPRGVKSCVVFFFVVFLLDLGIRKSATSQRVKNSFLLVNE